MNIKKDEELKDMGEAIKKILIILIIVVVYLYTHELAHDRIFRIYDCEDIEWGMDMRGFFVGAVCEDDNAKEATALNEIIGYTVALPLFVIIALLLIRGGD